MESSPLNIVIASSEVAPLAKTGGLADVCGALPAELVELGHAVSVFMPAYRHVYRSGVEIESLPHQFDIPIGGKIVRGGLARTRLPGTGVEVYLIQQDEYFDRAELYREHGSDYRDNCERFVFFCRAVLEAIRELGLAVDIIHANDWQTALLPAYLKIEYRQAPGYENIATLFTIHNLAYQGVFWHWDMLLTGLDWKYFNWRQLEFYGDLNLMKAGIVFADAINTVSPRYAEEIQTPDFGCGLEGVLQQRREMLFGILNGIDDSWDPAVDPHLPQKYGPSSWREGKGAAKRLLRQEFGLPESEGPLLGYVGRLASQKGIDLLAEAILRTSDDCPLQWVVLGTGEPIYHAQLQQLQAKLPGKFSVRLEFSERLAHLVEAGSDMFVMPSRYEPCGLNQMYSLRYGAVPIVRRVGGLADTVVDTEEGTLEAGTANGFSFDQQYDRDPGPLVDAVRRACALYAESPETWGRLVQTGMAQDWSWSASAKRYVELYSWAVDRQRLQAVE